MPIKLTCSCGKQLQVSDEFAGRQGQCPACQGLLQIPEPDATVTRVPSSVDDLAQAVFADPGLAGPRDASVPDDAAALLAAVMADLHAAERVVSAEDANGKLTAVGCVLTLLTVAVIFGVALPLVRWRDPETGQPLPRLVAVVTPFLIGALFNGIVTGLLRVVGLRIWSTSQKGNVRPPQG